MKHRSGITRRPLSLVVALALHTLTVSSAIAQTTPCMEKGAPCERPGDPYLGDNQVELAGGAGVYNSQSSDTSYFGKSVIPAGGYLRFAGKDILLVDSTGYRTLFVSLPSKTGYFSMNRLTGDRREISVSGGGATLYDPRSGERVEFAHRSGDRGFPTAWKNSFGHTTYSITYQGGVPVSAIDQMDGEIRFSSSGGLVTSITYPLGEQFAFSYDSNGRLTQVSMGERVVQKLRYDQSGKLSEHEDNEGNLTLFAYKGPVLVGTGDGKGTTTTIEYDAKGITARSDSFGRKSSERTDVARFGDSFLPTKVSVSATSHTPTQTVATMTRDRDGNITSFIDVAGRTTRFSHQDGLLTSISSEVGQESRKLDGLGRPVEIATKDPKGALVRRTQYLYQGDRVSGVTVSRPSGAIVAKVSYSYEIGPDQNVVTMRETREGSASFQYDPMSRPKAAEGARGGLSIERSSKGDISAITVNGVRTTIDSSYANGTFKSTTQGGGVATTSSSNLLGSSSNSTSGDSRGRDITSVSGSSSGNRSEGSSTRTFDSTTGGAAYAQESWATDSVYATNSRRVVGRGKPGKATGVTKPKRSFGGGGSNQLPGGGGTAGNNPSPGGGNDGGNQPPAGGGGCCPPNARCAAGVPPCGSTGGGGNNQPPGGGNNGGNKPPAGGGGCCPPNAWCAAGVPPCGSNGGGGNNQPPAGGNNGGNKPPAGGGGWMR